MVCLRGKTVVGLEDDLDDFVSDELGTAVGGEGWAAKDFDAVADVSAAGGGVVEDPGGQSVL